MEKTVNQGHPRNASFSAEIRTTKKQNQTNKNPAVTSDFFLSLIQRPLNPPLLQSLLCVNCLPVSLTVKTIVLNMTYNACSGSLPVSTTFFPFLPLTSAAPVTLDSLPQRLCSSSSFCLEYFLDIILVCPLNFFLAVLVSLS